MFVKQFDIIYKTGTIEMAHSQVLRPYLQHKHPLIVVQFPGSELLDIRLTKHVAKSFQKYWIYKTTIYPTR